MKFLDANIFIYAYFLYPKEMIELTAEEPLSLEEIIRSSADELGIKNVIEAIGLERVIEAIGLESVIEAVGLEKIETLLRKLKKKRGKL